MESSAIASMVLLKTLVPGYMEKLISEGRERRQRQCVCGEQLVDEATSTLGPTEGARV